MFIQSLPFAEYCVQFFLCSVCRIFFDSLSAAG